MNKDIFDDIVFVICAVIIILAGIVNLFGITAKASPTAGVSSKIESLMIKPPITEWQKDILEVATSADQDGDEGREFCNNNELKTEDGYSSIYESHLTRGLGIFAGPSGKETWYNLPMGLCIRYMEDLGYSYEYWIRSDGVKMYGPYVMCAADLSIRPKGTILETSLGKAIVCDTGEFVNQNRYQVDIATNW